MERKTKEGTNVINTKVQSISMKKTEYFWERGSLFVKIPEPETHGYPSNTWIAITGVPPRLKALSSTHLEEALSEVGDPEIVAKLSVLSGEVPPSKIEKEILERVKEKLEKVV